MTSKFRYLRQLNETNCDNIQFLVNVLNFKIVIQVLDIIVEFTFGNEEKNEAPVMEKVLEISKHLRQLDFKIDRTEVHGGIANSLSEIGEMESLKLQMAMDRLSKMMSTLSNLMKKIADTAEGIIQNLK